MKTWTCLSSLFLMLLPVACGGVANDDASRVTEEDSEASVPDSEETADFMAPGGAPDGGISAGSPGGSGVGFGGALPPDESVVEGEATLWFADIDGDGYGDQSRPGRSSVAPPDGHVANDLDCDDSNTFVFPGAPELNSDQLDSDCDGVFSIAPFVIGDYGPAGGVVFQTDGIHGLEAAPNDQDADGRAGWGCRNFEVDGATGTTDGSMNTAAILAAQCPRLLPSGTELAPELVDEYTLNGYDDWYLPAVDELVSLSMNHQLVGGFTSVQYWSSTQVHEDSANAVNLGTGSTSTGGKGNLIGVRAIRKF